MNVLRGWLGRWPRSLKGALLLWLVPGLLCIMGGSLLLSTNFLRTQVDAAYDRALAGALRAIDFNISTQSGGLAVEQPYLLLEFFALTVNGRVYFRVATEDGLAEIGNPALPMPDSALEPGVPQFYNALYLGEPVRVGAILRDAKPAIAGRMPSRIVVQVAEGLKARDDFESGVVARSVERDLLLLAISSVLLVLGVVMALRPLLRLRDQLDSRAGDDLSPIEVIGLPTEVQPLVHSINQLMARNAEMARTQRQFLDDASHQLRTPLAVLRTQVGYALREQDPAEMRAALTAMQDGLTRAERLTQQMLALARARARDASPQGKAMGVGNGGEGALAFGPLDLCNLSDLVRQVVKTLWPLARARHIDLGLELGQEQTQARTGTQARTPTQLTQADQDVWVNGAEWLLREALSNLVDNAIRYTPAGGQVTVEVRADGSHYVLRVEDSGCGMSDEDIARAGSRFRRGTAGKGQPGAGLGLAIVRTIADLHGAKLVLCNKAAQTGEAQTERARTGLCVELVFPVPRGITLD